MGQFPRSNVKVDATPVENTSSQNKQVPNGMIHVWIYTVGTKQKTRASETATKNTNQSDSNVAMTQLLSRRKKGTPAV